MELWIRSQDKHNLIKVTNLSVGHDYNYKDNGHYYTIQEYEYSTVLGYYKSKERALEVLDEIQHILNPIVDRKILEIEQKDLLNGTNFISPKLKDIEISEFNTYVYEMPKE